MSFNLHRPSLDGLPLHVLWQIAELLDPASVKALYSVSLKLTNALPRYRWRNVLLHGDPEEVDKKMMQIHGGLLSQHMVALRNNIM